MPSLRAPGGSRQQPGTVVRKAPAHAPSPARATEHAQSSGRRPARSPRPPRAPRRAAARGGVGGASPARRVGMGEAVSTGGGRRSGALRPAATESGSDFTCGLPQVHTPHLLLGELGEPQWGARATGGLLGGQAANDGIILLVTLTAFPTLLFLGCPERVLPDPPPPVLGVRICLLTQVHNILTFLANDPFPARETRYD